MARNLLIAIALALSLAGCLRLEFDRCDDEEPHPDCALVDGALDGALDGGPDASVPDGEDGGGT